MSDDTGRKIRPGKVSWVVVRALVFVATAVGSHRKGGRRAGQTGVSGALRRVNGVRMGRGRA